MMLSTSAFVRGVPAAARVTIARSKPARRYPCNIALLSYAGRAGARHPGIRTVDLCHHRRSVMALHGDAASLLRGSSLRAHIGRWIQMGRYDRINLLRHPVCQPAHHSGQTNEFEIYSPFLTNFEATAAVRTTSQTDAI